MNSRYQPAEIESKWSKLWKSPAYPSNAVEGSKNYCIMLPPPNITGSLHMGHAFQQTLMDILIRHHRLSGKNTLWQGGYDHAGIATQMMVERELTKKGQTRQELGREGFLEAIWAWKEQSGHTIMSQMSRLGASLDWENCRYTMDKGMSEATLAAFVQLYRDGLIYQGSRLVNWDPVLKTALSDLEVENLPVKGHLWHIRYPIVGGDDCLVVATTRPETLFGDTGVAVHPDDERYRHLIGKKIQLPLCDREIPIIADDSVDREFGTGCVKLTPAHDFNDYEMGQRHQLKFINILTADATLNESVPKPYQGLSREQARKMVVTDLDQTRFLEKTEDHEHQVPHGDRSGAILEPWLTKQWYLKMDGLAKAGIDAVKNGEVRFVPENWENTYYQWLENIQDWCLSRQLWWGHRIPAWYDQNGNVYVGMDEATVRSENNLPAIIELEQDPDVLDTWFSSALWPFATLGWPEKTSRFETFFPTQTLVTGFDIIFFWVARMIMMSLYFTGKAPFKEVYVHGLIRDEQGKKMSKTKGNVIDPIDIIDGIDLESLLDKRLKFVINPKFEIKIKQATQKEFPQGIQAYGTDALRFTFAALATHGRDINFDFARTEGYRNFCNKLWNAARYIEMSTEDYAVTQLNLDQLTLADKWILSELSQTITATEHAIATYRFDWLAQGLYEFTWNNFCDWYLEASKVQLNDNRRLQTQTVLISVISALLRLLHPIIPFITEEIWQSLLPRLGIGEQDSIIRSRTPKSEDYLNNATACADFLKLRETISAIRKLRSEIGISPAKQIPIMLKAKDLDLLKSESQLIEQLAKTEKPTFLEDDAPDATATTQSELAEIYIPLPGLINPELELDRLNKQITKLEKESMKVKDKLSNEKYRSQAPSDIVMKETEKLALLNETLERMRAHKTIISVLLQ